MNFSACDVVLKVSGSGKASGEAMSHKFVFLLFVLFWSLFIGEPGSTEENASDALNASNAVADDSAASSIDSSAFPLASISSHNPDPDNAPVGDISDLPIKYWGNSSSGKFHRPSCPFAKAMNSRHVVFFHFRHEAIGAGQQPCHYCLPPFVKRVQSVLLPKTPKNSTGQ